MKYADRALLGAGIVIPFWLALGVALTAMVYPGYSHVDHAMSLLGAERAPTQGFSAWVNNVPLGVLFIAFAVGVARRFSGSRLALCSALLIALHGVASFATGYFPCDQGCTAVPPSPAQQAHNLAGLLMFLSLTLASALWVVAGVRVAGSRGFARFSLGCVILAVVTVALMGWAANEGRWFGLYQRLNYGVSVIWVAALAWLALSRRPVQ